MSPVTGSAPLGDGAYTVRHESSHLQRPILEPGPTPRFIVNTRASASAGYLVAVRPRTDPCITRNDQRVPAETIRPIDARPVTAVISVKRTTESKKKGGHKDATDARLQDIIGAFLSQHSLAHGDCACTPEQHYISLHGSSDEDLTKMGHPSIKSLLKLTQDCGTRTGRLVVAFEREDGLTVNPVGLCKLIQMWDAQSSVSFFVFNPNHATTSYEVDAMAVLDMMKSLRRGDDVDRSTKAFHFIRVIINISVDQAKYVQCLITYDHLLTPSSSLALAYMDNLAINETARNTSPIDPDDASSDTLPSRSRTPVVQLERNCEGRLPCPLDGCCADTFDTLTKLTRHLVELCEDSGSCVLCSRMGRVGKTVAYYKEHIRTHLRIKAQDSSSVNVVQVAGYKSIDFFAELTDCVLCKATLEPSEIFDHHQKDCKRLSKVSREAFHSVACPICGKTMGVQSMYSHVEGHRRIEEIHRFAKALGVEQGNLALHF